MPGIETSSITPGYGWNPEAGRYINLATGQFVSFETIRNVLESVISAGQQEMMDIAIALQNHSISLAQWELAMMQQIRVTNIAAAVSARGGWAQMSQADWGFVGRQIRSQYDYLRAFADQIANGTQRLDGTFLWRVRLYGQASRGFYESMRRRMEMLYMGMDEERRVLGVADHCAGCLEQAELGWQPIGTLDPIGAEQCVTNCRCSFDFRKSTAAGLVPVA